MSDGDNLLEKLKNSIDTHLGLCNASETPIICDMLTDAESKQMLIDLVVKKVVDERFDIPSAIIAINNEFDPNCID